jgi:RNA polymerase sigma-70 factor, ECF subfamily
VIAETIEIVQGLVMTSGPGPSLALAGPMVAFDAPRTTGYNSSVHNLDILDIQACLNGDDQGYHRLLRRHETGVARLMWRFSRDKTICEELVQEVFVQAYFSLARYRGDGPFPAWLHRIATRVGYHFWKQQKRAAAEWSLQEIDAAVNPDPDTLDPSQAAEILHGLLSQLSPPDRLVLTLMYFEDCSTEDIAKRMSWTRGMVKMRAMRARKKLKALAENLGLVEKLGWIE